MQRTTLYATASHERQSAARSAAELSDVVNTPVLGRNDLAEARDRYPARRVAGAARRVRFVKNPTALRQAEIFAATVKAAYVSR